MRVSILVPRREGFKDRDALWLFCRKWWGTEFPDWPIIEGHHDVGLFNRSAAVNRAAFLAGDWDVAVIIDADVLADPAAVRWAALTAYENGRLTVPFSMRHNLNPRGTQAVMKGHRGTWRPFVARTYKDQHSSVIAVSRGLWEKVGGFDEGFSGWGLEDTAFAIACEMVSGGPLERMDGEVWHLYHASAPEGKHGSASHNANMARANRYRTASQKGDVGAVHALIHEGRSMEMVRNADRIPTTLHRVVPETSPAVAEEWWARFGELHPGWRLMTHRDPLDPAEWPMTSPHWGKVANGAQLADLVRLEALVKWGGVYVDQDVQPFRSLDPLLAVEAFAAWEDENVIPNAVLGARPDHPAMRECLEQCIATMRKGTWDAGPGVTTRVLANRPDVLVLPPGAFYDVHYRDPLRDVKMQGHPPPWAFVRHHYWGSWLPEDRRRVPVD